MKKTLFFIAILSLLFVENTQAQGSVLDDYSHLVVPIRYEFQDSDNQFQLNSLIRHTFKEEGFETFMSEEKLPITYFENPCDGLAVELIRERNVIRTMIIIQLKDCRRKVIFQSKAGTSREKDTRAALHEAFKEAFLSIEDEALKSMFDKRERPKREMAPKKMSREEQKAQFAEVVKSQSDHYRYAGTTYLIFKRDQNFEVYDKTGLNKIADIKKADGKTFLYHADEINGVANFDEDGNLIVQYMDEVLNDIETFTYKKITQ